MGTPSDADNVPHIPPSSGSGRLGSLNGSDMFLRRLHKDYKDIVDHGKEQGIMVRLDHRDITSWTAVITGPENTPWEGGLFRLAIKFSERFPVQPPVIKFITPVFHPNIYVDGVVCMSTLKSEWSPCLSTESLLLSIQSLLSDPNPDSAANGDAARVFRENPNEYYKRAHDSVEQSLAEAENSSSESSEDDGCHEGTLERCTS